jgi:hypothetical protein
MKIIILLGEKEETGGMAATIHNLPLRALLFMCAVGWMLLYRIW